MSENNVKYQTKSNPLFEDLLWSRPENKQHAGKLLIIGGNKFSFNSPAEAYNEAERAGAGAIRVILPDSLRTTISKIFPAADFAQSNPSGGFSNAALAEIIEQMDWACSGWMTKVGAVVSLCARVLVFHGLAAQVLEAALFYLGHGRDAVVLCARSGQREAQGRH